MDNKLNDALDRLASFLHTHEFVGDTDIDAAQESLATVRQRLAEQDEHIQRLREERDKKERSRRLEAEAKWEEHDKLLAAEAEVRQLREERDAEADRALDLAPLFAQVRDSFEKLRSAGRTSDILKVWCDDGTDALSAIERHVQDMEKALRDVARVSDDALQDGHPGIPDVARLHRIAVAALDDVLVAALPASGTRNPRNRVAREKGTE